MNFLKVKIPTYFPPSRTVGISLVSEVWDILDHPFIDLTQSQSFLRWIQNSLSNEISVTHIAPGVSSSSGFLGIRSSVVSRSFRGSNRKTVVKPEKVSVLLLHAEVNKVNSKILHKADCLALLINFAYSFEKAEFTVDDGPPLADIEPDRDKFSPES